MTERVLGSETIFEGKILSLRVDEIEAADGHRGTREVVTTRGAVAVVCVDGDDLVLVRQYRHPLGETILEIPAGMVDDGESPEEAAARELAEEVGLRPKTLTHLCTYHAAPGFTDHWLSVFFTDDVEAVEASPDDGEVLEIVRRPWRDARRLLDSGEAKDSKTVIGIGLALLRQPA